MMKVLLLSENEVLVKGFAIALPDFQLSAARDASGAPRDSAPDIVLVDLSSEIDFSTLRALRQQYLTAHIVLWVHSIGTELALQAMATGVRGILRSSLPIAMVVKCLERVHAGEFWFEKALTDEFLRARRVALTRREGQLVSLLSQGLKNKELARILLISEGTVKVYLSRLFQKTGAKDRFELALYGLKNLTTGQGTKDPVELIPEKLHLMVPQALFLGERRSRPHGDAAHFSA